MKTDRKILTEARNIIANGGWTQGNYARNKEGEAVFVFDPTACKFCLMGSLQKVLGERVALRADCSEHGFPVSVASPELLRLEELLADALRRLHPDNVCALGYFNDTRTLEEVLAVYDEAIRVA